jgi:hypothetical protein
MSMFDELMKNEQYRKIFDQFPDDQKPLLIERIKNLMDETENKLLKPVQEAINVISTTIEKK